MLSVPRLCRLAPDVEAVIGATEAGLRRARTLDDK